MPSSRQRPTSPRRSTEVSIMMMRCRSAVASSICPQPASKPSMSGMWASRSIERNGRPDPRPARSLPGQPSAVGHASAHAPAVTASPEDAAVRGVVVHDQDRELEVFEPARPTPPRPESAAPAGSVKWNVLPRPTSLSTQIRPPISSTSCEEMARPEPGPAVRARGRAVGLGEGSKIGPCLSGGMPMPVSRTAKCRSTGRRRRLVASRSPRRPRPAR